MPLAGEDLENPYGEDEDEDEERDHRALIGEERLARPHLEPIMGLSRDTPAALVFDETPDQQFLFSADSHADVPSKLRKPQARAFVFNDDAQQIQADFAPPTPTPWDWCMLLFCPCFKFIARHPIISEAVMSELKSAIMSFSSLVTFAQFVMVVVSISIAPIAPISENALVGPDNQTLIDLGALQPNYIKGCVELWRFFSSLFLHAGVIHFLFNCFMQLRLGLFLERRWRWIRVSIIFFLSGFGGNLLSCVIQPLATTTAPSSAFIGVMGAYFVEIIFTWYKSQAHARVIALLLCIFYVACTIILAGVDRYITNSGAFGGLTIGVLLGIYYSVKESQLEVTIKEFLPKVIVVIVTIYFVSNVVIFFSLIDTSDLNSPPSNATSLMFSRITSVSCDT